MPELPEVETTVRALRKPLVGQKIIDVKNDWPGHIVKPDLTEFRERIHGLRIESVSRRGKYLLFQLSAGETLIIHLKMSGHLSVVDANTLAHKHVHTTFSLSNGQELRFRDQRKFGRIYLVHDPEEVIGNLGPEPLEPSFTVNEFKMRLKNRKRVIKPLLLDQTFVAGIGNIYANEALYYAAVHPTRRSDTFTAVEINALHQGIQKALNLGLDNSGASIDLYEKPDGSKGNMQNEFVVHGREGDPCGRCGQPIERIVLGGRSTYFCPKCQTK